MQVGGAVALLDAIPPELFTVPPDEHAGLIVALTAARSATNAWHSGDRNSPLNGAHITTIRNVFRQCPDAVPAPTAAQLMFVMDAALRDTLRADISTIERAIVEGDWKTATVLAGATIEALLLWALEQRDVAAPGTSAAAALAAGLNVPRVLEEWNLQQLLVVARQLNIVKATTSTAADLARAFRNLIHPGRERRLADKVFARDRVLRRRRDGAHNQDLG